MWITLALPPSIFAVIPSWLVLRVLYIFRQQQSMSLLSLLSSCLSFLHLPPFLFSSSFLFSVSIFSRLFHSSLLISSFFALSFPLFLYLFLSSSLPFFHPFAHLFFSPVLPFLLSFYPMFPPSFLTLAS